MNSCHPAVPVGDGMEICFLFGVTCFIWAQKQPSSGNIFHSTIYEIHVKIHQYIHLLRWQMAAVWQNKTKQKLWQKNYL